MAIASAAPAPTQTSHATRPIPPALVPVAVLLAVAVAALALMPSVAQAVWELPHLVLLGLVVSFGVFAQKNAGDGEAAKEHGALAWNSRYRPDDPLVVVADGAASDDDDGEDGASGTRPLSLPVRRLKRPPPPLESETGDATSDDGIGGETDSSASTAGFWAGARAVPSPPSVLEAVKPPNSIVAAPLAMSKGFPGYGAPYSVPRDQSFSDDGEVTDWDKQDDDWSDEMVASSEMSSFHGDFIPRGDDVDCKGDGDHRDVSVDEELLELAAKAAHEGEDEVDRKADEFIAKFREQIRRQRL